MCCSGLYWSYKRDKRCVSRDCIGHISEIKDVFFEIVLIIQASKEVCFLVLYWLYKRDKRCVSQDYFDFISE